MRQTQVAHTCSTGSTSDTAKLEPKLVSVAQPTAALRTSAGNTSPTISHATGPKDTCTHADRPNQSARLNSPEPDVRTGETKGTHALPNALPKWQRGRVIESEREPLSTETDGFFLSHVDGRFACASGTTGPLTRECEKSA